MFIFSHVVYDYFHATRDELHNYDRDFWSTKCKIFIIWLFIEGFASADFIIPRGLL